MSCRYVAAAALLLGLVTSTEAEEERSVLTSLQDARAIAATVDELPPIERERLQQLRDQFSQLTVAQQQQMRELHRRLWDSPKGEQLFGILERYRDWLSSLSAGQRDDLLALPVPQRIQAISRLKAEQDASRLAEQSDELVQSDAEVVVWVRKLVQDREVEIIRLLPPDVRAHLESMANHKQKSRVLMYAAARHAVFRELEPPSPQELGNLMAGLSLKARQHLESVSDPEQKMAIIYRWIETSWRSRHRYLKISEAKLESFYANELTSDERELLDRLPAEEMQEKLKQSYIESRLERLRGSVRRPDGSIGPPPRFEGPRDHPPGGPPDGRRGPPNRGPNRANPGRHRPPQR